MRISLPAPVVPIVALVATVATTQPIPPTIIALQGLQSVDVGAWTVDGHVLAFGDTLLVKNEAAAENNGLYNIVVAGSATAKTLIVRDTQMSIAFTVPNFIVPVSGGATQAHTYWMADPVLPFELGVSPIPFDQMRGPAGGGGDDTYIFNQSVPAALWVIVHNLGQYPSVTVVDSGGNVVIGDVFYVTDNELRVSFDAGGFSGTAYLNS